MDGGDDPSTLVWPWVIEAVAARKEIPNPTLLTPVGKDKFGENVKEMVSLRCLETLSTIMVDGVASSSSDSRAGFDFSRSCQDVLQEILDEQILLSNLKMNAPLLKSDLYPFINHKRAATSKCHLEQLRQTILEGTHPHTDYLKERSGLFPQNNSYSVIVNDVNRDDHSAKEAGNSANTENVLGKDNSVSLENGNKSSREHLLDNNSSPSKSRVYSVDDYLTKHFHGKQVCVKECGDFFRTSKRVKLSASTSFEPRKEKPDSQHRQEVSEHLTERILLVSEQGDHRVENNNKETVGGGSSEDIPYGCNVSKLCQPSSHIEVPPDESNIPFNDALMLQPTFGGENSQQLLVKSIPHEAFADGIQHGISGGKPKSKHEKDLQLEDPNDSPHQIAGVKEHDHTGNGCRVEVSGDIGYQSETNSLKMKKQTVQNLCLKCNEGDQLPIRDVNVIQPVVTECCLGMATTMPTNDANAEKNQQTTNLHQPKQTEPDITALNLSQEPVACDETIVGVVNGCGAELSSDSDEYHNEKKCLEAKKHEFLHSHCMVDHDFKAMNEPNEKNLCMKCNQGGQLLACKTTTCPMMVHENCLGAFAQFDAKGDFFCPFCTYSHTISEYIEAKKEASLARKELAIFISKGKMSQAAESLLNEFRTQEHCFSRKSSEYQHIHVKNNKDEQLTKCGDNREDHVDEHANEANNLLFGRSQQQTHISCTYSSFREKENISNGSVELLREEKIGQMPNAENITGVRGEENKVPTDHVDGLVGDTCINEKENIALVNKSNAGYESPQETAKQLDTDGATESVCEHNTGKEEMSENESEKHRISRYSMRYRKHKMQCKPEASPAFLANQLRRKYIPWTAEEEEMLRHSSSMYFFCFHNNSLRVQKFGFDDPKKWKNILAFGSHVFQKVGKRRTPIDLKDKWKNMCKASPKSK
ncbi:uncharacterized protein LOC106772532 isoform X3 [Vigna radiata var. radiata]|uniref:Uncharacterized protein LOC106772532 isoform X3 n=1 Tax=Vigna radiata var. radiata TaxID=3916 RepID=A0A3Q0FCT6_VIGRR|nr:uncharacterized protein LOC106772532 isoform X3 [Vigna radiata var. radiata]